MSLAQAKARATEIASRVVLGEDPVAEKKKAKSAPTFKDVAERWLREWPAVSPNAPLRPRTLAGYSRSVQELVERWGNRKAADVLRADVIELLDEIRVDRDAPVYSNRMRSLVGTLFSWAVQRGLVAASPVAALPPRVRERARDRVLSPTEIKTIWQATAPEQEPMRSLFRFLLTGQRSGETRLTKWVGVEGSTWRLPAENTKAGRPHAIPLSPLAAEILDGLRPVTGEDEYVFASPSARGQGPIKWVHRATERIRERSGVARWSAHDLRRTCGSGLRDLGVAPDVIGRLLNHSDALTISGSTPIYVRSTRWPEMVEAMRLWGEHLETIRPVPRPSGRLYLGVDGIADCEAVADRGRRSVRVR